MRGDVRGVLDSAEVLLFVLCMLCELFIEGLSYDGIIEMVDEPLLVRRAEGEAV